MAPCITFVSLMRYAGKDAEEKLVFKPLLVMLLRDLEGICNSSFSTKQASAHKCTHTFPFLSTW